MFDWLLKGAIGAILSPILSAFTDVAKAKIMKDGTVDEHTATMAVETLRASVAANQQATALLVAEQGNLVTRWVRPLWALPFVYYTVKVIVVDPAMGWSSPPLSAEMTNLMWIVAPAYFGGRTIEKVAQMVVGRKK